MEPIEYRQLKAYARIDGALLCLVWTLSLACMVGYFSHPSLGTLSSLSAMSTPFLAYHLTRRFRDKVRDGILSFMRALAYSLHIFFYASVLFALVQYVYFAYIDGGYLFEQYRQMFASAEGEAVLQAYGITESELLEVFTSLTPIELGLQFMTVNIFVGIVLSLPVALLVRRRGSNQPANHG